MEETKKYIEAFLMQHRISISPDKFTLFNEFIADDANIKAVGIIKENQKIMLEKWVVKNRVDDIVRQPVFLPNGTVNKRYEAKIDFALLGWNDFKFYEFRDFKETGLEYDSNQNILFGVPEISGDFNLRLMFRIESEKDDSPLNEKIIRIIINPDPKSLWKNIPGDKNDPYWKEENVALSDTFLDKKIVIASKRGRSHANVGTFRDDDFAFRNFEETGWSVVAVSDGAGGYPVTRKGSQLACDAVITYFEAHPLKDFDTLLLNHHNKKDKASLNEINSFVYENLSKAAWYVHQKIEEFAVKSKRELKDFHSTLIFALVKKYDFGYAVLTFGVGDCPIGVLNKDVTEVELMNWLDVGEFGGGTRFITMPEIFQNDNYPTRFGFKLTEDFSYLMLMTDGIYDPKFVVEANLEKVEKWQEFISDLKGQNDDKTGVDFDYENPDTAKQISTWMDFWNPGNHDDRTLAIIY